MDLSNHKLKHNLNGVTRNQEVPGSSINQLSWTYAFIQALQANYKITAWWQKIFPEKWIFT
jgi:hypothetical protein